jgi:hypothetical protein
MLLLIEKLEEIGRRGIGEEEDYFFPEDLFMSIISKIDFFFSVLFSLFLDDF